MIPHTNIIAWSNVALWANTDETLAHCGRALSRVSGSTAFIVGVAKAVSWQ